jgi:hypothetical protein
VGTDVLVLGAPPSGLGPEALDAPVRQVVAELGAVDGASFWIRREVQLGGAVVSRGLEIVSDQ